MHPPFKTSPDLKRRRLLRGLAALPLLSLPTSLLAQVGHRYSIELLIFEHTSAESRRLQQELAAPLEPNLSGSELGGRIYQNSGRGFQLQQAADRVESSGTGRVLARLAWDQLARDHASTPWLRIQQGRRLPADTNPFMDMDRGVKQPLRTSTDLYELEGRLRVWVGHYLHLETDLIYHVEGGTTANGRVPALRVRGHQRMNSGDQLYYLDHPVIGIIGRVTRADS